jgi:hypothetical protein
MGKDGSYGSTRKTLVYIFKTMFWFNWNFWNCTVFGYTHTPSEPGSQVLSVRGPQLPRAQLSPFLPHSNWEAGALILLAGSFLTMLFTRSPRRKQLESEEIQVILPSAWISVKKARSGNEASDWLVTEFPAKDKARMKSNEFNTEI